MSTKLKKKSIAVSGFIGPLIAAILVAVIVGFTNDRFWNLGNLNNLSLAVSITALMAIGSTLVIFTGGIDLSIGSMIALITMAMATLIKFEGWSVIAGLLFAVILGAILGAFNGLFSAYLKVPSFIATLAGLSIFKGIAFLFNNGSPIFSISENFEVFFYGKLFGIIPLPFIYVAIFYIFFVLYMNYSKLGREIYAVGGNEIAAKFSGINVKKVKFITFVIAGAMAGIASILMASRLNSGSPNYGSGMELSAIAAAVIGGASLLGGRGDIINTLLGALIIIIVQNGLNLNAVPTSLQSITIGIIILIAVLIDMWKTGVAELFKKLFGKKA
ncbi:MAG: ABC transporter permease [Candidatus Atribacteria bacterium]|nr:ABC transporter permease [Candidatus Atribacteria bacterium]